MFHTHCTATNYLHKFVTKQCVVTFAKYHKKLCSTDAPYHLKIS